MDYILLLQYDLLLQTWINLGSWNEVGGQLALGRESVRPGFMTAK